MRQCSNDAERGRMRVVAVLDLRGGKVVHGVAGHREVYRPIVSRLTNSVEPIEVARALRSRLLRNELYLADLDAIAGADPNLSVCTALQRDGFTLWVDAGIRSAEKVPPLINVGVERIVVGLETVAGPDVLSEICAAHGERVVFSLDLRDGQPLGQLESWQGCDAWTIACQAVEIGVSRLLVLDLARVGVGGGTGTEDLLVQLAARFPGLELSAGGGIRGRADLERLRACGVKAALVASALHDGRLDRTAMIHLASGEC